MYLLEPSSYLVLPVFRIFLYHKVQKGFELFFRRSVITHDMGTQQWARPDDKLMQLLFNFTANLH